jgi:hypothetical protein
VEKFLGQHLLNRQRGFCGKVMELRISMMGKGRVELIVAGGHQVSDKWDF